MILLAGLLLHQSIFRLIDQCVPLQIVNDLVSKLMEIFKNNILFPPS